MWNGKVLKFQNEEKKSLIIRNWKGPQIIVINADWKNPIIESLNQHKKVNRGMIYNIHSLNNYEQNTSNFSLLSQFYEWITSNKIKSQQANKRSA